MPTTDEFVEVAGQNTELLYGSPKNLTKFHNIFLEDSVGKTIIGISLGETMGNYGEMPCYCLLFSDGTSVSFEFEDD